MRVQAANNPKTARPSVDCSLPLRELSLAMAQRVRAPLARISAYASQLQRSLENDRGLHSVVEGLCHSVDDLSRTLEGVASLVGRPALQLEPFSVRDVLVDALKSLHDRMRRQGVHVARRLPKRLPAIRADRALLKQALLGLLDNALDAMSSGGRLEVGARVLRDGRRVEVTIGDNGPGMAPEDAERLFEPLVSTKPGRTGIGLGAVRRIIRMHAGSVTLRPGQEGGTDAVVQLRTVKGRDEHRTARRRSE
jgi:signal transduction histidine kinase